MQQKSLLLSSDYGAENIEKKTIQETILEPIGLYVQKRSKSEIREQLGSPNRTLREGQMSVWQYATAICQWDLYFQEDPSQPNITLYDLIIHHQGRILTDDNEISLCERSLRQAKTA